MATAYTDQVQKVYIAYYGRAADPVGLAYWAAKVETDGLDGIMASFGASAEATTLYGSLTNTAKVNALYQQCFGRDADFAGLMYYAGQLTAGTMTATSIAQNIFDGASGNDATILTNKLVVAKAYTAAVDTAAEVVAYSGTVAAASARTLLSTVDASTVTASFDVATTIASVVTATTSTANAGTTYVLTDTNNTATGGADNFTGGAGDDTFLAQAAASLSNGDVVDGGAGADTLTARYSVTAASTINTSISNVETVNIDLDDGNTGAAHITTINTSGFTGLTDVVSKNADSTNTAEDTLVFSNMAAGVDGGVTNGDAFSNTTFTYKTTTGLTDTATVNLNAALANVITVAGIETVTINAESGTSVIDTLTTTAATTLNITGSGKVTLSSVDNVTTTIDASAATGNVTLVGIGGVVSTITGGSGDDSVNMGTNLTAADTVDLGAGTDTIIINADTITMASLAVSNVETVQAESTAGNNLTVASAGQTGLTTLNLVENNNTSINSTVSDLAAGVDVTLTSDAAAGVVTGIITLALADASGTADVLNVELKGTNLADAGADNDIEDLDIKNIETLNLTSSYAGTVALATTDWNEILDISADTTLTTVTVSGTERIKLVVGSEATSMATLDASAATGDNTLSTLAVGNVTVTGGSGDDTLIFGATLNNSDVVDAGAHGPLAADGDTLTATVTGLTATTGALSVANVETLNLTNAGTVVLDATAITGATEIAILTNTTATTITNLGAAATVGLGHNNVDGDADGTLTVSLADETGSSDSITINLNDTAVANTTTATIKATAIETVNFTLTDTTDTALANTALTVSTLNAANLVLAGADGDVTHTFSLGTLDTDTSSVTATAYKGLLTVSSGAATNVTYDLGGSAVNNVTGTAGGIDTVTVASTTATHVLDAGAGGADILTMTLGGTVDGATITNFETINLISKASTTGILALDGATQNINDADATTVNVSGGNSLSVVQLGSGAQAAAGGGADVIGLAAGTSAAALVTLNATGLDGQLVASFGDNVVDTNLTITGGNMATDTIYAQYATGTATPKMSAVEKFYIQNDGTSAITMSGITGLTTVYVDDDGSANDTTLTDIGSGVAVELTSAVATALDVDLELKTATDNSLSLKLNTTVGTSDIDIADVETLNLNVQEDAAVNFDGLSMTTASAVSSLVVSGDSALTLTALHADVTTIDGSGMTTGGSITQNGRSSTEIANYTGSLGGDDFMMVNKGDVLDGGAGADNLNIDFTGILGGLSIDLSSTTDQIDSMNGSTNPAAQTNFENVDLNGFTGFGASVTGSSGVNHILGTVKTDSLSGGAGDDIIGLEATMFTTATKDVIDGGTGTDYWGLVGGHTIAVGNDWALMKASTTTIDQTKIVTFGPTAAVISATFHADFDVDLTGAMTIDISADTNIIGANVIDVGEVDEITTIIGSSGVDTITTGDEDFDFVVTGGNGADVIISGNALNTEQFIFAASGALNGQDAITGTFTIGLDRLDITAFSTGLSYAGTVIQSNGTADVAMANKVIKVANTINSQIAQGDTAAEVLALIQGASDALEMASGGKGIVIFGSDNAADTKAHVYYVDDTVDGTNGTLSGDDVFLVGTLETNADLDLIVASNFILA
jgi:hypothetical protein